MNVKLFSDACFEPRGWRGDGSSLLALFSLLSFGTF